MPGIPGDEKEADNDLAYEDKEIEEDNTFSGSPDQQPSTESNRDNSGDDNKK